MAHTKDTETLTLAADFRSLVARITASPSVDLGRRYPTAPVSIFIPAATIEDVATAAIANGSRIYRDGVRTYTDITAGVVQLRFFYVPAQEERLLVRPVDVTDELAGRDA